MADEQIEVEIISIPLAVSSEFKDFVFNQLTYEGRMLLFELASSHIVQLASAMMEGKIS